MKSIAIWNTYNIRKKKDDKIVFDLHLNNWILPLNFPRVYQSKLFLKAFFSGHFKNAFNDFSKNNFKRFFDIGLKIKLIDCSKLKSINIAFPSSVVLGDIAKLPSEIHSSPTTLNAIFNSRIQIISEQHVSYTEFTDLNSNDEYFWPKKRIWKIEKCEEDKGTYIKIDIPPIKHILQNSRDHKPSKNRYLYLRFRLLNNITNNFYEIEKPKDSLLKSAFSLTEIFDLRINEFRNVRDEVFNVISDQRGDLSSFNKCHCLIIRNSKDSLLFSSEIIAGARLLEGYWNKYLATRYHKYRNTFIAYHWKTKSKEAQTVPLSSCHLLTKFSYKKNNSITILTYLFVLFLITLVFNVISSVISPIVIKHWSDMLNKPSSDVQKIYLQKSLKKISNSDNIKKTGAN